MGARLRVVLDQLVHVVDPDQAAAAVDLTFGLVATAPSGCAVDAIVPSGAEVPVAGVDDVRTLSLARRELAASWQLGFVRHDRVHDNDQTTVTLWDLAAWDAPESLSKATVAWQRGMLRRAVKHADAVVVPSHAIARRLAELVKLGDRIRVIAGAAPGGFAVPEDASQRRAVLSLPERYVVLTGSAATLAEGFRGAVAADLDAVVLDAAEGTEPRLAEIASSVGLPERRAHGRGALSPEDRAALLAGAQAFVGTDPVPAWPWRAVEAMSAGVPVVAIDSGSHHDVIADGGRLVAGADLAEAVSDAVGSAGDRLRVLAADRSRAFSWASSAERVWGLHADL
jgi:glycosyltransferase involved in cell wall biosynthesis